jgi:lipoate-protein ligase A
MDAYAYVDEPRLGESNMTIDRLLLEAAEQQGCAFVRLYRWSQPTLSLGHFQADCDRNQHPPSASLPVVLRASGGGAIVHDREWTYSVAIPVGRNKIGAATQLYDLVHGALVDGLQGMGWNAQQWVKPCASPHAPSPSASNGTDVVSDLKGCAVASPDDARPGQAGSRSQAAFLCFQRRSCGDIVCEGSKVVGSAQRRLGASVLQHGSILCASSQHAPELPGLAELPRSGHAEATQRGVTQAEVMLESETFGQLVLSWVLSPLIREFGLRVVELEKGGGQLPVTLPNILV